MNANPPPMAPSEEKAEEKPDPPRNFTTTQLVYVDGKKEERSGEDKPVNLSGHGIVFDV